MNRAPLVLVCTCHGTLSKTLPVNAIEKGVSARHPQARIEFFPSLCRAGDLDRASELLKDPRLSSVLFAACSPFAKGRAVLELPVVRKCGCSVDLVDIREGCAWIHSENAEAASEKAVDLICMGLAGQANRGRSSQVQATAENRVLVVGAGPAGLAAAGTLARLGVPVTLADRLGRQGGLLNQVGKLFPNNVSSQEFLDPLIREAAHPAVEFLPKAFVTLIDGDPGNFRVQISREGQDTAVTAGAVILACGGLPVLPEGRYRSGELSGVLSQLELETRLRKMEAPSAGAPEIREAVFIQCMAARDEQHPYCSSICCPTALKNGLRLKDLSRDIDVTILHRGIMAPGRAMEELYREAMAAGVRFIAYPPGHPPEVQGNGRAASVSLTDALSGRKVDLPADVVVLSTPLKSRPETAALAGGLGIRLDRMGFACGCEPMRPLVAPVPGVYLCGAVRWPVYAEQAVDQGRAAAAKAAAFLRNWAHAGTGQCAPSDHAPQPETHNKDSLLPGPGPGISSVRTEACSRCGQCVAVCPYGACSRGDDGNVRVSGVRCQGCGLCTAVCPSGAARIPEHNLALRAMLREIAPGIS